MEFFIQNIYPWLRQVSIYSTLIPFLIGLFLFRKHASVFFKLLLLLAVLGVVGEASQKISIMIGTRNNLWMSHVYTPLAAGIITAIYYHAFENVRSKKLVLAGFALLLMVSLFDAFGLEGLEKNNTFARLASNSFIIVLAISYFYKIANDMKTVYLDRDPLFLLSCAILIYYAGTSMASALFNQALEVSHDAARICLSVVFILNILFNAGQGFVLKRMAA